MRTSLVAFLVAGLALCGAAGAAADGRGQYPAWLRNSFIDFGPAYLANDFSSAQLEPGFGPAAVNIPHMGARVTLLGHNFSRYLSAQATYMRPVVWTHYAGLDGAYSGRLLTNVVTVTARTTTSLGGPFSTHLEGGLAIVTRGAFSQGGRVVIKDADFPTTVWGGGLKYRLNQKWDLQGSLAYVPANEAFRQPSITVFATSAVLNLRPLPDDEVRANSTTETVFPKNVVQVGRATNALGTGPNDFMAGTLHLFWGGHARVARGMHLRYQRNLFHTRRLFSLDGGMSVGNWWSVEDWQNFTTVSVYPMFRFTPIRTRIADAYVYYSLAGPSYLSRCVIDGIDTGRHFTFQDLTGLGWYFGERRQVNLDLGIGHYSNGNLFPHNSGVKIPLTASMGVAF